MYLLLIFFFNLPKFLLTIQFYNSYKRVQIDSEVDVIAHIMTRSRASNNPPHIDNNSPPICEVHGILHGTV